MKPPPAWAAPASQALLLWGFLVVLVASVRPHDDQSPREDGDWNLSLGNVVLNVNKDVVAQFSPANVSHLITHLTVDPTVDDLYIGAVNRLYQLNSVTLKPVYQVVTGPRLDSPLCHASSCGPHIKKTPTYNYNKVLIAAPSVNSLIVCGSVSQGACDKYTLGNISLHLTYIPRSVAANDPNSSTFAFVGPERHNWGDSQALYVGTTFTTVGDYRHDVPALSTRNLFDLDYNEFSFSKQSLLRIDVKYRDNFLVNYVYGFNTSSHIYFLMVQKKSHLPGHEESGYVTRISRNCISDHNYDSYAEVTLRCLSTNDSNYNLIQDAKIVSAGDKLAASFGVSPGDPLLVGAFSPSESHTSKPQASSAICVYAVKDIEEKFNENIHMCFNGSMRYRNLEYISGSILGGKCPQQGTMGNIHSFCEVGLKISGPAPIVGQSVLLLKKSLVTGLQGTSTATHTVAFLGTSSGTIKKVLLKSSREAIEYDEIVVDSGKKILPDLKFSRDGRFLYAITAHKVSKVRVESCSSYEDCSSCLGAQDPYCGWCSLEKRCTVQQACERATFSSPRWLSFSAGQQCIDFEMILPDRIPIDQEATVQLTINTLPSLPSGAKYLCVWGAAPPLDAVVTRTGLSCKTPPVIHRPPIPSREDHALVPLAVRSSETNKDFVSRNFAFYDCGVHSACAQCITSAWACDWCLYENVCTQNSSACRKTVISGQNNPVQLVTHGVSFCPKFWEGSGDLLAADGTKTELSLLVENLPKPRMGQRGFECIVTVEGANMIVGAKLVDDYVQSPSEKNATTGGGSHSKLSNMNGKRMQRVLCEPTVYRYESRQGEYKANITLVWNRDHIVDVGILTLYKCDVLGSYREHQDCSLCVTRPQKYHCAWCGDTCRYVSQCPAKASALYHALAMKPDGPPNSVPKGKCPTPRIDVIQPLTGPIEGGTLVTIEGSNLGLREEDVRGRVSIGDVPCLVQDYRVSVRITCRTSPLPLRDGVGKRELQFPVRVGTPSGSTESTVRFTYTNVSVSDVWPRVGPASGGTALSLSGHFLNVGSHVSVALDELPCVVNKTRSSSHRLVCVTSRAGPLPLKGSSGPSRAIKTLSVLVDGAQRFLSAPFTYMPDPEILDVKPLRSPWSGGRLLTVHGTHLSAILSPKITVLLYDRILNDSSCRVLDASQMECPSPVVERRVLLAFLRERRNLDGHPLAGSHAASRASRHELNGSDTYALDLGFILDDVPTVRNLRHSMPATAMASLLYVMDPVYFGFTDGVKLYKGDTLVIEGENLNLASDESDVNVTIGTKQCNITSLALSQLVCTPPQEQPSATDEEGRHTPSELPLVVVRVGRNLRFHIGYLRYEMIKEYQFPPAAVAGVATGGLFLIFVSLAILVVYRRKSNQAEREYKRIQIQMDTLESNVRSECKQAFAELQTDITDLTADLESSGIPTLDYRDYVMKVFFPGVLEHPILCDPKIRMNGFRPGMDNAMIQFEHLITNRYFLLSLVESLEAQKSFNIKDKVNVASLLVVTLTGRMEYLTEVLRLLLMRLMEKSISTKHPQLMLRRTESVVEKMLTNWLALCMYAYLKEHAGPSLFLLYKAIKHQVEKGPVDAVTHDARYSLSEEKLLREQVAHSNVTIHLVRDEPRYEKIPYATQNLIAVIGEDGEKATCRVLDCDSISQVKGKVLDALYRNTPHSLRPSVYEVDLEWRHGRNGHLILADEDMTTKSDSSGWRRLNTLAHYGIADNALMALVLRPRGDQHGLNNANCGTKCNSCTNYNRSSTGSPVSLIGDAESNADRPNTYHLVRPADTDCSHKNGERTHKAIPEIFLTRLLSTKGTVQKFVDDFFRTILSANQNLPPAVKWLFDFFDESAKCHGIADPEVIVTWKSNSLPLRFWVNFIKNPDFILDIYKSPTVDSCLSVIAQTFMDACSTSDHRLGKDSPSSKLLFAKDMPQYKAMVKAFYQGIREMPAVTDQDMAAHLHQLSLQHLGQLDTLPALHELFHSYVDRYYPQIMESLEMNYDCRSLHLPHKLENIMCTINGEPTSMC